MNNQLPELTDKAKRTRQHILDTALDLFMTHGYESTTMREIAEAAECSLGLTYRYFASKEQLVLAVYWQMAMDTIRQIRQLPATTIAERFFRLMELRLEQAALYRSAFRALFGAALHPDSGINVIGPNSAEIHGETRRAFDLLISEASDPPAESIRTDIVTLLYSLHFVVILFWLYDRSANQHTTRDLLAFLRDVLMLVRRGLSLPFIRQNVSRLAGIMESLFAQP